MYVDNTKCYLNINSLSDNLVLQSELSYGVKDGVCLSSNESVFLSFKPKVEMSDNVVADQHT